MKAIFISIFFGALIISSSFSQIIKSDSLNLAVLKVDYTTHAFEGGNLSYYQKCSMCNSDSLPFIRNVQYPMDFGSINFEVDYTGDIVFDAGIIWMGTGQINHPVGFSTGYPFEYIYTIVPKPDTIYYYGMYGQNMANDSAFIASADSAWTAVQSIEITSIFSAYNYKVGIYLYPPTVGMFDPNVAKWIVFLYYNDTEMSNELSERKKFRIFPNPVKDKINIEGEDIVLVQLFDTNGNLLIGIDDCAESVKVDVQSFISGIYYLKLHTKGGIEVRKIVII